MTFPGSATEAIRLSEIWIYPIKSCRGISCTTAVLEERGLQYDRRWMVVDQHGKFLSQRTHPAMALISVKILNGALLVSAPQMETLSLSCDRIHADSIAIDIWNDRLSVPTVSNQANEWFSTVLRQNAVLVRMDDRSNRLIDHRYAPTPAQVSFADAFPLLVISQASLDDLNSRLEHSVPMNRFRPNIVLSGAAAFAEDHWSSLDFGAAQIDLVKPCSRCTVITIDQETGVSSHEPATTLASYRTKDGKVYFGQNAIPIKTGTLHTGSIVQPTRV